MTQNSAPPKLKPRDFVHLHNHTHYSLLDGLQKVPEMLDRVKALGMDAVALTDHGSLSGAIEFYKEAKKRDIKPIIGIESYVARRSHTDKEGKPDANPHHIILLAMNNQGYENLMRLSTIAHLDGFYYKPRIDKELLKQYNEGLIVLSACLGGEIGEALEQNNLAQAEQVAKWYKQVFGDRYYLELQDHGHEWQVQERVNKQLFKLAKKLDIKLVVTSDAHYALPEDQEAHEVLLCVQTGSLLSDEKRMSLKDMTLYVSDPREIISRWGKTPTVITNTREIAERCNVEIKLGEMLIPKFTVPDSSTKEDYLVKTTYQGLAWRYAKQPQDKIGKLDHKSAKKLLNKSIIERTEYELGVINKMGFSDYFLIIADFMDWAKSQGIIFGPGRGSAAGSIVSYALGITAIDPLEYDLLFERFLNPDRISMPDIDIDIMDSRRDEVITYVEEKYGKDRVAHIATFGTMAARNAIRDTARVLGVPYADADRLAKMVPPPIQGRHIPLSKTVKENQELKREYAANATSKRVIDLAIRLEGTIRSHGVHAAGVVIAPDELVKYTPLEVAQSGVVATQYSMNPVEDIGLLKMDFLGLSNLTIIKNALRIIRKVHGQDIDIATIPLDDKKTFELLAAGDTTGVFQLESAGMKRYLKQLMPSVFEDIVAMVALYRPGPMQFMDDFIDRKHGRKEIEYMHPKMEGALKNTYGVLVYQEQVMQISKDLCGFSGGQADTLRKGISKKIPEVLAKMKTEFIEGGIKHSGAERRLMERFWDQLEEFAAYCFNKSHAACYAMIAYQTAYLKAHYPSAFMAALMTSDFGDSDRIAIEIAECRHMGIEVLPPDINESFVEFAVRPEDGAIRFALSAIKNVGVGAVEKILEARAKGPFKSLEDFAQRVSSRDVNRKTWESLIKAGAFDVFAPRVELLHNLDKVMSYVQKIHHDAQSGQLDMFGNGEAANTLKLELEAPPAVSGRESLQWEKELLGIYLSRHPLEEYEAYLKQNAEFINQLKLDMEGRRLAVGGVVTAVRKIYTRNGAPMAFVALEDSTGNLELVVFPKTYERFNELWEEDKVVLVNGKLSSKGRDGKRGEEIKILVDEARELKPEDVKQAAGVPTALADPEPGAPTKAVQRLLIELPKEHDHDQLLRLKRTLSRHQGGDEVYIRLGGAEGTLIKLPFTVQATALVDVVTELVGAGSVRLEQPTGLKSA